MTNYFFTYSCLTPLMCRLAALVLIKKNFDQARCSLTWSSVILNDRLCWCHKSFLIFNQVFMVCLLWENGNLTVPPSY